MKKMNENQLRNHEGGRFWGWQCGGASNLGFRTCCYYVAWVNTGCGQYNVGHEPGKNPKFK